MNRDHRLVLAALAGCLLVAPVALAQSGPATAALTLPDAIAQALQTNPQTLSTIEGISGAQAGERAARAAFLPTLSGAVAQQRRTTNLAAQGFNFPGLAPLIGPYNVFDARLRLAQTVFDWSKVLALRSAALSTEASESQAALAREQLASRVAVAYIEVRRSEQAIDAARGDLDLAHELQRLAQDQQSAGVASGIDVARADTAVARDQFLLSQAETGLARSRLGLQRLMNTPQGAPLVLASRDAAVSPHAADTPSDAALRDARDHRPEILLVQLQIELAELEVRSAQASRLPSLSLAADYGISSNTPERDRETTYAYGAQITVPIYTGGAIEAQVAGARSRLAQAKLSAQDVEAQIEQDVRLALATLGNAGEQLRAADAAQTLAERELTLARDRFHEGVGSNIDVVQAQNGLSDARRDAVDARAAYDTARANLAAATGRAGQFAL